MTKITLIPRISEKAYATSQAPGAKTYIFEVPLDVNKHTIARAVADDYGVAVTSVRTVIAKGKTKQSYRKGTRPQTGKRSDIKKAYVTLKDGDALPIFEEEAKQEAKATKAEAKEAKKAEKTKKETK